MALGTQWRGQRDTHRARFKGLVLFSLLLHLPLTPVAALLGFVTLIYRESSEAPDLGELKAIPIELLTAEGEPRSTASPEPSSPPPEAQTATIEPGPASTPERAEQSERDAGLEAGTRPSDSGVSDAALDGGDSGDDPDAGVPVDGGELPDPIALSGEAGRVVDANANVRLRIHNARIREHSLGPLFGSLLGRVYQWRDFFIPTGLDAIRDFDEMLIVGPQFRDSSDVAAVMLYRVDDTRIREAVDVLVRRSEGGHWLDAGVQAAVARADRADRTIVLLPNSNVVMVVPMSAGASALAHRRLSFPPAVGDAVVEAHAVSPWRVFMRTGIEVPKSIEWAKVRVSLSPDGGALADVILQDESEVSARENSVTLAAAANALTQLDLGVLGALLGAQRHRFVEPIALRVEGSRILGTVHVTPAQLASLLEMASSIFTPEGRRQQPRPPSTPGGAPSASGLRRPLRSTPVASEKHLDPMKADDPATLPADGVPGEPF